MGAVAIENWHAERIMGDLVREPNGVCAGNVRAVYVEKEGWNWGREGVGRNGSEVEGVDGWIERKRGYIGGIWVEGRRRWVGRWHEFFEGGEGERGWELGKLGRRRGLKIENEAMVGWWREEFKPQLTRGLGVSCYRCIVTLFKYYIAMSTF